MDFSPVYQELITALWYLVPLLIIAGLIRSPWFKGKFGEYLVNLSARWFLDKSRYHLIKNVTLPTADGTTQIDHVLVSEFGVFVVETKNMKGWIFGGPHQHTWTQKIYRSNHKFQNPLHQNYKHVKTLQTLLGLGGHQVHSVVVFVGDSTFKTPMPENVTQGLGYVRYIKSQRELVLSPKQVSEVRDKVASGRLKASFATDRAHARYVRGLVAGRYGDTRRRPSRGLLKLLVFPVLLLGVGAIGVNAYSNFVVGAMAIGMKTNAEQRVDSVPKPTPRQSESKPKAELRAADPVASSDIDSRRVHQPPSGLFLARQECNSLIAAAIGNQDPRLLRDRDKACARYKALQGDVH
ncbi:NERD domain-containing protein [Marinobacter vulgaris]|uniref:NERD domain-containing protein n=1 Tax=Marinobacter vulgaris TaxID=1928331 RepID=A0A2V3ZKH4_9GAMM|nr:nuclease-related domain-containing protein [Marinobacter vulgaris]PXX89528.1 NERD domain-containing protein [Marinobacter vulgaris]TSJ68520.1 NERD domain-containing protein [Marinobacter vulgaris]